MIGEFVILRSRDQGVMCGYVRSFAGRTYEIEEARQIHGWSDGANTLCEMAVSGCGLARISEPTVRPVIVHDVCGVYLCTPDAEENLRQSRWNEPYRPSLSAQPARRRPG
jgi:hypothetical protein